MQLFILPAWALVPFLAGVHAAGGVFPRLRIVNGCSDGPIWIAHTTANGIGPDPQNVKIKPQMGHDFATPGGLTAARYWAKSHCNEDGRSCFLGDSGGPGQMCDGSAGCAPPVDSRFEATFATNRKEYDWVDVGLMHGFTLPFRLKIQGRCLFGMGNETRGTSIDCSGLSFTDCPTKEDLGSAGSAVDLQVIPPGSKQVVGCYSPCSRLRLGRWSRVVQTSVGTDEDATKDYCCSSSSGTSCKVGAAARTAYTKMIHQSCPGVKAHHLDAGMGLLQCTSDTTYEMTFLCPPTELHAPTTGEWTKYPRYDLPDSDDAEHMDATDIRAVMHYAEKKGYLGFSVWKGTAWLKGTKPLTKDSLKNMGEESEAVFYLYSEKKRAPPPPPPCGATGGQCGGLGWGGATCCESGLVCTKRDDAFSSCEEQGLVPPANVWKKYEHYDLPDMFDAQQVDIKSEDDVSAAMQLAEKKGYSGFSVFGHKAYLKEVKLLTKSDLQFMGRDNPVVFYIWNSQASALAGQDEQAAVGYQIFWQAHPKKCLSVLRRGEGVADGLQLWDCNGASSSQRFTWDDARGTIRWSVHPDHCLGAFDGTRDLEVSKCERLNADQFFILPTETGQIRWGREPDLCLNVASPNGENGCAVKLAECVPGVPAQGFRLQEEPAAATPAGATGPAALAVPPIQGHWVNVSFLERTPLQKADAAAEPAVAQSVDQGRDQLVGGRWSARLRAALGSLGAVGAGLVLLGVFVTFAASHLIMRVLRRHAYDSGTFAQMSDCEDQPCNSL